MKNPFEVLGIKTTTPFETIKQIYKKRAFELHPDRNPNNSEAENKFKELNEAYEQIKKLQKQHEKKPQHDYKFNDDDVYYINFLRKKDEAKENVTNNGMPIVVLLEISIKDLLKPLIFTQFKKHCENCQSNLISWNNQCIVCFEPTSASPGPVIREIVFDLEQSSLNEGLKLLGPDNEIFIIQLKVLLPSNFNLDVFKDEGCLEETIFIDYPTLVLGGTVEIFKFETQKIVSMKIPPQTKVGQKFKIGKGVCGKPHFCVIALKNVEHTEKELELLKQLKRNKNG